MCTIVMIAGSPSDWSRSAALLDYVGGMIERSGIKAEMIRVRELPAEALIHGQLNDPAILAAGRQLAGAAGAIVATPVYKAAYSGVLKAFLDLLPQDVLLGKPVLPLATGGSPAHLLAIEYALKPVLASLGACHILPGVYAVDGQLVRTPEGVLQMEADIERRLAVAVDDLLTESTKYALA